jgi:membrane protein
MNFFSFIRQVHLSIIKHHGFLFAKSLVYQTIFCFIPGFFSFILLSQYFSISHQIVLQLEKILLNLFIPKAIENQLFFQIKNAIQLSQKAEIISVSIFLIALFSLLTSIQEIFYQISEQNKTPHFKHQFLLYLYFVLGIFSFIAASSFLFYGLIHPIFFMIPLFFIKIFNFILFVSIIFSFYFFISPISFTVIKTLFISFCLSIIIYLSQFFFFYYIVWFPSTMLIYGTIAFLPLLFFWIFLFWLFFLYGYTILLQIHPKNSIV